jgi:hypothetical protein
MMLDPDFETNFLRLHNGELDSWRARAKARHDGDQTAYDNAGAEMIKYALAARAELKAEALRYAADRKIKPTADEDTKVAQLLMAFARGCRLGRLWSDVMAEIPIGTRHVKRIYQIVLPALGTIGRHADLAKLLDEYDPSVRARAASLLKEIMPDRCIPILEEVYRTERMLDAGWIAMWALPEESVERIQAEHAAVAAQRRGIVPEGFG